MVCISDCTGAVVKYAYNSIGQRISEHRKINDDTEQVFIYHYDAAGRLAELKQSADEKGCGHKTSSIRYEYDHNGNLTRIRLPYGAEIRREYDAKNRLILETHNEKSSNIQNTIRFCYDKADNLTRITDNLGRETEFSYDLMNQEIKRRERDGGITRTVYDRNGNPVKIIRPNQYAQYGEKGSGIQYIYDSLDQITTVINADGRIQETYAYDKAGNLREKLDGNGNRVSYTYDLSGHYTYIQTSGNATQQYEYDPYGNITGIVDGEGNHTLYVLDEWGRIVEIKRADGESEFYRYDYAGNITKSVDANGNATLYEYNCIGKIAKMTDPLGYSEHYYYDVGNRLSHVVDRNGTETTYGYNLYNSLTERRAKNPSAEKMECCDYYQYTPEGLLKSAISAGNAKGISNMGMRYSYEYDGMGRLVRKSASGRTLLSYSYDLNGNLIRQEDVTGKVTEYTYNALDLLETVEDNGNKVASYVYYADGTVKSLKSGSLYTEYAYDADRNLTGLKTLLGTEVLTDNHYCYDHNGNRTEKQQIGGITRYTYDTLNQLTKVQYPSYTEELSYDRAGNRTRRKTDKVEELYSYDPRNRLTEYTKGGVKTQFTYDNAGNLLKDNKAKYTYDAFNHTEKVETFDGHVQINRYDAEGLRHEMEEDGKLVQFIFQGDEVVAEEKENNIIRFIRGYELIASDAESARTYYHYASDEMGSITHVVDDARVLNHYEYDAWGNTTVCEETVENRFQFNGQQYDAITQQYYLRARFYNPVIARFTQEDTYRGAGLNLYDYCANNPVYYEDPSGNVPQCVKEAATEYIEKGMSPEDAYCKAYAEHAERKLMQESGLSPQERYKLEQRKKRLDEKLPKSPEADNKKFYDEQYKRRLNQCPKEGERGHWLGARGESMYIPSNQKIKKILERYGLKGIKYKNGVPDFSDVAWKTVQVQGMAGGKKKERPRNINFPLAFNELSNQMGISSTKLKKWATQKRLTWHECNDMKTMQLIPTDINDYFGHMGGVGEINLYFDFLEGLF